MVKIIESDKMPGYYILKAKIGQLYVSKVLMDSDKSFEEVEASLPENDNDHHRFYLNIPFDVD